jgi:hypothetical protein
MVMDESLMLLVFGSIMLAISMIILQRKIKRGLQ